LCGRGFTRSCGTCYEQDIKHQNLMELDGREGHYTSFQG
jgi:hypothetical protein